MATEYKYDVFISYSRKDYVDEHKNVIPGNEVSKIKEALTEAGITYWFDEEGIYSGDNFTEKIIVNIEASRIFLFLSTKNACESQWTSKEIACADEFGKYIIPVRIDKTPYSKKVMFRVADLSYVDYGKNPEKGRQEIVNSIKVFLQKIKDAEEQKKAEDMRKQKEEEERKKREEQAKKKKEALNEIKRLATDFRILSLQQDTIVQQLHEKNLIIGKKTKDCPVCNASSPIETAFCERCGFQFPQLYGVDGNESYPFDNRLLVTAKDNYDAVAFAENEREKMKKECQQLKATLSEKEEECQKQLNNIATKDTELNNLRESISLLQVEINRKARENEIIKTKNNELKTQYHELEEWKKLIDEKIRKEEQIKAEEKSNAEKKRLAEEKIREQEALVSEKVFTLGSVSFKMIRVEGGNMGTFYIGETQVTQALWQAVMGDNPSRFEGPDHPVECVKWYDICGKDGTGTDPKCFLYKLYEKTGEYFRLPSEAEWEYAAMGGNINKRYTFSGSDNIDEVAWYAENSKRSTHPVNEKFPNELGIYGMSGNVWELCYDFYRSSTDHVLRGGSWNDAARYCCVSSRNYVKPDEPDESNGFRLVLSQKTLQ